MPAKGMITLQSWRLENTDGNHYKQYTILANQDYVLFFNCRIGSTWVNQSPKGTVPDPLGKAQSQYRAKLSNGYDCVWAADVTVPEQWAADPARYKGQLQDFMENLYREGQHNGTADSDRATSPTTTVAGHNLAKVLDDARHLVSKMAVDPDSALQDYPALVGAFESVKEDMDVAEGYMDTLRLMLAGAQA